MEMVVVTSSFLRSVSDGLEGVQAQTIKDIPGRIIVIDDEGNMM